ncbi:MAG: hypothetical protein GEV10_27255 [Streptosporangiales bacterium]|nr:hypothetical protein [Streptosporangiales bacterium]
MGQPTSDSFSRDLITCSHRPRWRRPSKYSFIASTPGTASRSLITVFLTELFPTEIRASGYGIAYSLPSILPAFYSWYMLGLATFMPYEFTPVVLLAVGGLFLVVGALLSADRRHVELSDVT